MGLDKNWMVNALKATATMARSSSQCRPEDLVEAAAGVNNLWSKAADVRPAGSLRFLA